MLKISFETQERANNNIFFCGLPKILYFFNMEFKNVKAKMFSKANVTNSDDTKIDDVLGKL